VGPSSLWHPQAPPQLAPAVAALVEINAASVCSALQGVDISSPAFALCLGTSENPEDLYPYVVSLGLDADRDAIGRRGSPWVVWVETWNPSNYTYSELEAEDPPQDPRVADVAEKLVPWLTEVDVLDYARWALEETAAWLTRNPPVTPVTDDFVAFPSEQGEDLMPSLRWIAPPVVQRQLEEKRLLLDDFNNLEGAPERW
jgi:hypothetical protein